VAIISLAGCIYIWTTAPVVIAGDLNVQRLLIHIAGTLLMVGINVGNFYGMRPAFRRDIV
jgi:hypothetical protein